jgi:hypothetical protein
MDHTERRSIQWSRERWLVVGTYSTPHIASFDTVSCGDPRSRRWITLFVEASIRFGDYHTMKRYIGNFEVHRFSLAFSAVQSHHISGLKQQVSLPFATWPRARHFKIVETFGATTSSAYRLCLPFDRGDRLNCCAAEALKS